LVAAVVVAVMLTRHTGAGAQQQGQVIIRGAPVRAADLALIADPAQNAAQQEAIRNAVRTQYQPLLKAELSFANRVCGWTPEERTQAIAVGKACLDEFIDDVAVLNRRFANRQVFIVAGEAPAVGEDPAAKFESALADALRGLMTDDQRKRYEAERDQRAAFRAEASIENIVSMIDQRLELSPDQREKITDALRAKWKSEWSPPLQMLVQMGNYIPAVPSEHVVPFLSDEQAKTWQGVQKISAHGGMFMQGVFGGAEQAINDIDLNEAP
jgi:hypothetical protein